MSGYTIPYVTTRGPTGDRTVDVYSRLLDERIVSWAITALATPSSMLVPR